MRMHFAKTAGLTQIIAATLAMICGFGASGVVVAQPDSMSLQHGRIFTASLAGMELVRVITHHEVLVARAIRPSPFLELQFSPPVPERRLRARQWHVYCEEVGVYAPPGGASWTIAKA